MIYTGIETSQTFPPLSRIWGRGCDRDERTATPWRRVAKSEHHYHHVLNIIIGINRKSIFHFSLASTAALSSGVILRINSGAWSERVRRASTAGFSLSEVVGPLPSEPDSISPAAMPFSKSSWSPIAQCRRNCPDSIQSAAGRGQDALGTVF